LLRLLCENTQSLLLKLLATRFFSFGLYFYPDLLIAPSFKPLVNVLRGAHRGNPKDMIEEQIARRGTTTMYGHRCSAATPSTTVRM
jgi:hypothetical protein